MPTPISYRDALRLLKVERKEYDRQYRTAQSSRHQLSGPDREKLGALVVEYLSPIAEARPNGLDGIEYVLKTELGALVVNYNVGWGTIFQKFEEPNRVNLNLLGGSVNRYSGKWNFHFDRTDDAESAFSQWKNAVERILQR